MEGNESVLVSKELMELIVLKVQANEDRLGRVNTDKLPEGMADWRSLTVEERLLQLEREVWSLTNDYNQLRDALQDRVDKEIGD